MRSLDIRLTIACFPVLVLALGVLTTPQALAQSDSEFKCTLETFKGQYMIRAVPLKHDEAGITYAVSRVGIWRADGQGGIPFVTEFRKQTHQRRNYEFVVDAETGIGTEIYTKWGEEPKESQGPAFRWTYSLEPDCRGRITVFRPDGVECGWWPFILANGGREGVFYETGSGTGGWVTVGTLRRIDNADQELENRAARIEESIRRIALRLGINPADLP